MCFFSGIIVLALWLPAKANTPLIMFAALYGLGSGAFVSLIPAVIAQISDIREIGLRIGTEFAVLSVAALVSNPIGGASITRDHGKFCIYKSGAALSFSLEVPCISLPVRHWLGLRSGPRYDRKRRPTGWLIR